MIRSSVRMFVRLLLSVVLSWTLIPVVNAHAQSSDEPAVESAPPPSETPEAAAPESESSSSPSADASSEPPARNLNTIPEDGLGNSVWLSGATRVVREITAKRPNEDLVICIAGCVEKQDLVVFAQPAEVVPKKPDETTSDAAPVSAKPATAVAFPARDNTGDAMPVVKSPTAKSDQPKSADLKSDGQPAIDPAAKAGASADMKKSEFEPSMAQPKAPEAPAMPAASASEGAAPPSK
jgi:hypothetical protein